MPTQSEDKLLNQTENLK